MKRRFFLKASVTATGGMMLGFHLPAALAEASGETHEVNAWLEIGADNSIVIRAHQAEMGQGSMTALPMIIAEELEVDWQNVTAEFVDVNRHMTGGEVYGRLWTGGSSAVREGRELLQRVGAEARHRLIKAAANRWAVDPATCFADFGEVRHRGSSKRLSYGAIAADAARMSAGEVEIKTPEAFNFLGLPTPRLDGPRMVNGSLPYAMDVRLPGMVYAAVAVSPVVGGEVRSVRSHAIRGMPGVIDTVRLPRAVAVVAEHYWQAHKALEALPKFWDPMGNDRTDSQTFQAEFVAALDQPGRVLKNQGDAVTRMDYAEVSIESDYVVPYLAHAMIEPLNCTAHITEARAEVWVGHQDPAGVFRLVQEITGKPAAQIQVHQCHMGGSFGRRSDTDFVGQAIRIAMAVGRPVQVLWSQQETLRGGKYRPMAAIRFKAGFDIDGNWIAYENHSVTHSIQADMDPNWSANQVDSSSVEGLLDMPYHVSHRRITHQRLNTHLTSWWWRSNGHSQNCFAMECFVDEMASAAEMDPLAFRRRYLSHRPALLAVLDALAEKSSWRRPNLARGHALGMAIHESRGTICGQVAEVSINGLGEVEVHRIVCVVDCGNLVNELAARQQVEGGIVFGLSAALYGKLTVENGVVLEDNLDTYRMVAMKEMPDIDIHFLPATGNDWGGLGEPSVPPVAPAVCNALFRITGRRLRSLPLKDYFLRP